MNLIQEILNILERKEHKKTLELKKDWFEFGRTKKSSVGNPLYTPKMTPHAIRFDDLKCQIISGLVEGTGTEHTLPMWSTVNQNNCNVQTIVDSIFSQDAGATEGLVSGDFRVTGNTVLEGDLLVLGTQTIVESTIVEVADNIMRINSGGAGVDAGIEVIQPSGTKTWAWDTAKSLWSTFGESIYTEDIIINNAIKMDAESIINIVNEAEGLASNDNDASLATVAAIKDYVDSQESYVSTVALNGTSLDFTGIGNGFAGSVDLSSLAGGGAALTGGNLITVSNGVIDHDYPTFTGTSTSSAINLNYGQTIGVQLLIGQDPINNLDLKLDQFGHVTGFNSRALEMPDWLGITNVALNGTDLEFTSTAQPYGGFNSSVDLSSLAGGNVYDLQQASNVNGVGHSLINTTTATPSGSVFFTPGTNMVINQTIGPNGEFFYEFNASGGASVPVMSSTVTGTGKLFSDVVQPTPANPVTDTADRTYGVQFNDAGQLVVNVPWTVGSGADGNDFVSNVTFDSNTSVLDFTGSGGAFNGSINLAALASTETLTSLQFSGGNLIYIDENGNGTNVPAIDIAPIQNVLGDGLATSSSYDTQTGVVTISPIFNNVPTQNSQALVTSGGIWSYIDALTFPNDIDYVSAVVLNGTNLEFTSVGNGFSGSVSLATLLDDTNTTYDLGSNQDASDVNIRLTGSDATSDNIKFIAGTNITLTDNGANEITIDAAGGSSSYTFGTYLTETNGTVNHDTTNTLATVASEAPAHGDSFTAISNVVTNTTGHVIEVETKTITLPTSDVACVTGIGIQSSQPLTSQWQVVGQGTLGFPMGFSNNSGEVMQYALTFTLQFGMSGITGVKGFNVKVVADSQTTPIDLWQFDDSNYFVSELSSSHTWTYTVANVSPNQTIEVQIQGDTSLTIEKGQLTIVETPCGGVSDNKIQLLPVRN